MDFLNDLHEMCETLSRELGKANEKISMAGGSITGDDLSYIDRLTHAIKSIKTTIAMMEAEEGESGNYMPYYGGSYNNRSYRGNYSGRRRDSMGRYTSRRGGMSYDDGMVEELRGLMEQAPNEETKREFRRLIDKLEKM